jgi:hypothetical protein
MSDSPEQHLSNAQSQQAMDEYVRDPNHIGGIHESRSTEGWVIDPADGEKVYQTGRGRVAQPDYEVHALSGSDYDNDDEVITTYTSPQKWQGMDDVFRPAPSGSQQDNQLSPDDARARDKQEQAYWKQVYRQRAEQQANSTPLSQRDMWQLSERAKGDAGFHKYMESFDSSKAPKLNPQQQELFRQACTMLGSKMENANDPNSISPRQILGALTYYGIGTGSTKQQQSSDGLTNEQRALVNETEAQLASAWSIQGDTREYDTRIHLLGQIAQHLTPSDVEKINRNPVRGIKALWDAFESGKLDNLLSKVGLTTSQGYRNSRRD